MRTITFLKNSFQETAFAPRKCLRCNYLCVNSRDEKTHKFLLHYQQGGRQPIEDKPLKMTIFNENLQRYCIDSSEHGADYDFYNSRKLLFYILCLF